MSAAERADVQTIREALLTLYQRSAENDTVVYFGAVRALQRLVAGSAPDPRDAVVEAAQNFMDDVGALDSEDLRLHDLQNRIGAIWLGYGGGFNHEDDLRFALERAALGSPVEPTAQQRVNAAARDLIASARVHLPEWFHDDAWPEFRDLEEALAALPVVRSVDAPDKETT